VQVRVWGKYDIHIESDEYDLTRFFNGRDANEAAKALYSFYLVLQQLKKQLPVESLRRVAELFGGIGMEASALEMTLTSMDEHMLNDLSPVCVAHLRKTFPWRFVRNEDAFAIYPELFGYDLVHQDAFSWYARDLAGDTYDVLFRHNHRAIIITDTAPFFYHMANNGRAYLRGICAPEDVPLLHRGYAALLRDYVWEKYGYSLVYTCAWNQASHHLFIQSSGRLPNEYEYLPKRKAWKHRGAELVHG